MLKIGCYSSITLTVTKQCLGEMVKHCLFCVCENDSPEAQLLEPLHTGPRLLRRLASTELIIERFSQDGVQDGVLVHVEEELAGGLDEEGQDIEGRSEEPGL